MRMKTPLGKLSATQVRYIFIHTHALTKQKEKEEAGIPGGWTEREKVGGKEENGNVKKEKRKEETWKVGKK